MGSGGEKEFGGVQECPQNVFRSSTPFGGEQRGRWVAAPRIGFLGLSHDGGVRIEDDVLVTKDGRRNLSGAIPSDPDALEAIIGQR